MERHDGGAIQWIETVELAPGARESWVCCLEPGEIVTVSLSASGPVDAALVDLDAYETWDATDEMPFRPLRVLRMTPARSNGRLSRRAPSAR